MTGRNQSSERQEMLRRLYMIRLLFESIRGNVLVQSLTVKLDLFILMCNNKGSKIEFYRRITVFLTH